MSHFLARIVIFLVRFFPVTQRPPYRSPRCCKGTLSSRRSRPAATVLAEQPQYSSTAHLKLCRTQTKRCLVKQDGVPSLTNKQTLKRRKRPFSEGGGGEGWWLGRRDDRGDSDGARRRLVFVLDPVGDVGLDLRLARHGDGLVSVVLSLQLVEGSLRLLRQAGFLLLFLPLTPEGITSAGGPAQNRSKQHGFITRVSATYLFLHPVVFVDGVLVFGRRYPEERGHPLPQIVTGWETIRSKSVK